MTQPAPDLSRLRINRDEPAPALRRALWRNLIVLLVAVLLGGGALLVPARRAAKVMVVQAIQ